MLCEASPSPIGGIAHLSEMDYPAFMGMKSLTIKLPESVARKLQELAQESGRSVSALIRERLETPEDVGGTVYALTADIAGILAGGRMPGSNSRRRFRRS
jgi:predicted transcriptional regulator